MKVDFTVTEARTLIRALRIYRAVQANTELTQASNDRIWREVHLSEMLLNRIAKAVPVKRVKL